ncbi:hypothetical protein N9N28_07185 [Rubripirellula amarantea]|uniref:Uncharacterized protein n=1 Tax=Rubripirellula amarantea TaxID=2527999 RepID=A0A5C5WLH4_9BACT|nr:hypothetical protein [Rubripirellula amarantea]MDA8744397.1 hypothetical protein [Rubripirellula amarantea]TWT50833.1 hypothetical protein Pla22_35760 [Rubripirellula amarantea]
MRRSLALSLLAALTGSTYAELRTTSSPTTTKSNVAHSQTTEQNELSEKQQIMLDVRRQVGSELSDQ